MQTFRFAIRSRDDSSREETGCMALSDDGAALAFGEQMIRDMTYGNVERYAGWMMDVTDGDRPVYTILFDKV